MKLSFRDWLLQKLLAHKVTTQAFDDSELPAIARRLGVDLETFVEARTLAKLEHAQRGRSFARRRVFQIDFWMPELLWKHWLEECRYRNIESPVLLRSLIHEYLLGESEPKQLLAAWRWRGHDYEIAVHHQHSHKAKTQVTRGAWYAMKRRADAIGATRTTIIRGLVLEVLDGGHDAVHLVDAVTMYDDPSRYAKTG